MTPIAEAVPEQVRQHRHYAEIRQRLMKPDSTPAFKELATECERLRGIVAARDATIARLNNENIDLNRRLVDWGEKSVRIGAIIDATAKEFGVPAIHIKGISRNAAVTIPRHVAMTIAREIVIGASLPQIGRSFGGRDHTTILHAIKRVEKLIITMPEIKARIESIKTSLANMDGPHVNMG